MDKVVRHFLIRRIDGQEVSLRDTGLNVFALSSTNLVELEALCEWLNIRVWHTHVKTFEIIEVFPLLDALDGMGK